MLSVHPGRGRRTGGRLPRGVQSAEEAKAAGRRHHQQEHAGAALNGGDEEAQSGTGGTRSATVRQKLLQGANREDVHRQPGR